MKLILSPKRLGRFVARRYREIDPGSRLIVQERPGQRRAPGTRMMWDIRRRILTATVFLGVHAPAPDSLRNVAIPLTCHAVPDIAWRSAGDKCRRAFPSHHAIASRLSEFAPFRPNSIASGRAQAQHALSARPGSAESAPNRH
jgi:hypothetical protein